MREDGGGEAVAGKGACRSAGRPRGEGRRPAAGGNWWAILAEAGRGLRRGAAQIIGQPDYNVYVDHCRRHHPERPPMSREAFFRNRLEARYGGAGGRGCC